VGQFRRDPGSQPVGEHRGPERDRPEPAPGQPVTEPGPPGGESPVERRHRHADPSGGLVARGPIQVAENERSAERLRQPIQLLVQGPADAVPRGPLGRAGVGAGRRFVGGSNRLAAGQGLAGGPQRDAVEPRRQGVGVADRRRPADERQECRLEGIVGVRGRAEDPAADAVDHRPVPVDDIGEGVPFAAPEPAQGVGVIGLGPAVGEVLEVLPKDLCVRADHGGPRGGRISER
jgi:hypothetical protein